MSIIDLLLETDPKKLETKFKKEYEVERLSKILGEKFVITCSPLTSEQIGHIGEISKNHTEIKKNAVLECCKLEGKKIASKELMERMSAHTPFDLLDKLFLPGEVHELYSVINEMSGYGEDAIREIKN